MITFAVTAAADLRRYWRRAAEFSLPAAMLFCCVWTIYFVKKAVALPRLPEMQPDSASYLSYVDFRPPGYFAFLSLYRLAAPDLQHLPQVQMLMVFVGVGLLGAAVAMAVRSVLVGLVVLALGVKFMPWTGVNAVMSEPMFTALVCSGAAAMILYGAFKKNGLLSLAAWFFALATVTRTVGVMLLVALAVVLVFLVLIRRLELRAVLLPVLIAAGVLAVPAMTSHSRFGEFGIGSTGGDSILGKALLIAKPLPASDKLSALNWIPEELRPVQTLFWNADDPELQMLMARQYYEYLRYERIFPELEARWPEWAAKPLRRQRGLLSAELSSRYIAAAPDAYLKLVGFDYASLWALPRVMSEVEQEPLKRRWSKVGDTEFVGAVERREANDYHSVVPSARSVSTVWITRVISALFFLASILLPLVMLVRWRSLNSSAAVGLLMVSLGVQATYLMTALNEAGLERYAAPFWPLIVAGLALAGVFVRDCVSRASHGPAASP